MVSRILLCRHLRGLWLAFDGTGDGFLSGAIVEVLDFLVVLGFPMDKHADGYEEIVGLVGRDYTFGDGISDRHGHGMLGRAEHMHRLSASLMVTLL